ncbi:uncharacterized protein LOC124538103 [Vanessa cardui]|uniref:uncharacterized protein LOC124538103 n=1 Tax=Vanessa cardui TaxID=171605 RepID=UPI001F134DB0|nr:uncharacterized protein LOC124538103 [Vanessa cardui]
MSSRDSYGDDAVSYVQVKREDEEEENVLSVRCEDCVASQGGCKHAIAFLMWIHRRSEEPSCTSIECYRKKSKLSRVGSSLKYITAKELSKGNPVFPGNSSALKKFLQEAKKRKIADCELLKYQPTHCVSDVEAISMHKFAYSHKEKDVEDFLGKIQIAESVIQKIEELTREQSKSALWFELRYGRITASKAFEVSRCKTSSPDGIFEDGIIEIKCPLNEKTYKNYVKNGT